MREQERQDLAQTVVALMRREPIDRRVVRASLMTVREVAVKGSQLMDLCDAVAHSERHRGESFDFLRRWTLRVRRWMTTPAMADTPMPGLHRAHDIIKELNEAFARAGAPGKLDAGSHTTQCYVSDLIADALHGTTFKLADADARWTAGPVSHGAGIAMHDDFVEVQGVMRGAGLWFMLEWLRPDHECLSLCTGHRNRSLAPSQAEWESMNYTPEALAGR